MVLFNLNTFAGIHVSNLFAADLETEEPEVVFSARQKIATLSSCFAQLTHKALTIFQNSAKLEVSAYF